MASASPPESEVAQPGAKAGWGLAALGLALALAAIGTAGNLISPLPVASLAGAMSLFYLLVFGPITVLALVMGRLSRVDVVRVGDAPGLWVALGLACGIGGLLIAALDAWLNGGLVAAAPGAPASAALFVLGVGLTLFQAGAEELLFRGWLQPLLTRLISAWPAVLLSALAFSLFHALGGAREPVSFVNLFLGGVWFALLAWRSGGLLAPLAAHFGWNAIEDLGLGLVPNPGRGDLGSLRDYDIVGASWWGGSPEGLNASIGMTLVLIALILPLLRERKA